MKKRTITPYASVATESPDRTDWYAVSAAVVAIWAALMPPFCVASMAVSIRQGVTLSSTTFGLVLTCFFAVTAIGSGAAARVARRVPPQRIFALTNIVASLITLLLSQTQSVFFLAALLVLAGVNNALVQPAASILVRRVAATHQLSFATGLLGAALGAAPLVPGLLTSFLVVPFGWRIAMSVGAVVILLSVPTFVWARISGRPPTTQGNPMVNNVPDVARNTSVLFIWTLAAAFGTIGVGSAAMFFVSIGVQSGLAEPTAAFMFTLAGILAVIVRVLVGATGDRRPDANPFIVTMMMVTGAVGLCIMSIMTPGMFVVGALLAVAGGWGWTGLLLACAIRLVSGDPARAGAAMQIGLFTGAAAGPLLMGALATTIGLEMTIQLAAAMALAGAIAMQIGSTLRKKNVLSTNSDLSVPD